MNITDYIWESFQFPIKLTNISCELGRHDFPADSIIEIHRDEEFNFIAKIYGKTNNPKIGEYSHPDNKNKAGEFIEGENIVGYDINNKKFLLEGCHVKNVFFTATNDPLLPLYFSLDIRMDFLTELSSNEEDNVEILMELFLTGKTSILFSRNTHYYDSIGLKLRKDIDGEIDGIRTERMAWDYMIIKLEEFSFIVQKVQDDVLPSWSNGFVIEYRNSFGKIPSEEIRIAIAEIISFMLGVEFMNIGCSEFNSNNELVSRYGIEPYGDNLIGRCTNVCMPPMRLPKKHSRIDAEDLLSKIVSNYLHLRKALKLNTVLWKYWLAKDSAIGINLPVLSSGLEGLAETYLKHNTLIPKSDDETTKKYNKFLSDNSAFIEGLKEYSFGKSVINKIQNPYNIGVGEKLQLFFNSLDMNIDKDSIENEALMSRNKMTHSSSGIDSIKRAKAAIKMTRAYETLFHRTILKVLNCDGGYTDYYTIGHPERKLSDNIEKQDE